MATDVSGDYEDQERYYGEVEVDPFSELSTIQEMTEQAAADMQEAIRILVYHKGEEYDDAYGLAKMVVEHRMRVMGERY